jgi:hypothetical protein
MFDETFKGYIVEHNGEYFCGGRGHKLTKKIERAKVYRQINHAKSAVRCHHYKGAQILRVSIQLEEAIPCD